MTVYISKEVHFSAAHKLYNSKWSREQNERVFGKCANENWHGHNFNMIVTIKGEPDPDTGFVMNFKILKKIITKVEGSIRCPYCGARILSKMRPEVVKRVQAR